MDWQTVVAFLVVALASLALLRRMWKVAKAASGHGRLPDCGNCIKNPETGSGTPETGRGPAVVEIGKPPQRPSSP